MQPGDKIKEDQNLDSSEETSFLTSKVNNCKNGPKALILGGKHGLLGKSLAHFLRCHGWETISQGREDVDICNYDSLAKYIEKIEPECILNTIAYTKVDQAEDEKDLAFSLNKTFPSNLARIIQDKDIYLITYSTDYVFDGKKHSPYTCADQTNPLSIYGQSKLAGEKALLESGLDKLLIIRTSWLFGPWKTNFVNKMIDLACKQSKIKVVHDQVGSPTYTLDLACYTCRLFQHDVNGIFHICNRGQASWCELAAETLNIAGLDCSIEPISSDEFPQKAKRPSYSILDTSKFTEVTHEKPRPWLQALRDYMFCFQSDHISCED